MSISASAGRMSGYLAILACISGLGPAGCGDPARSRLMSYQSDVTFMRQHGVQVVELTDGAGRVAIAPGLQGRVMTSAFSAEGRSLGWVNQPAIAAGEASPVFNNFGGQDRLWFGPEGGQFSLYFAQGREQTLDHWIVPEPFNKGGFEVVEQNDRRVRLRAPVRLVNASGVRLDTRVERSVELLSREDAAGLLGGVEIPKEVEYLGLMTANRVTNEGRAALTEQTGTFSIWILSMFPTTNATWVIAPYRKEGSGPEFITNYFGEIPGDRFLLLRESGVGLLRADARYRSKIGVSPVRVVNRIGAMDFENNVLTIVQFDLPAGPANYVNSQWQKTQAEPFSGDVVNSYNHGGTDGAHFYELETSSPAAFLEPGQSIVHTHRTFQFRGAAEALSRISAKALGVSLEAVRRQTP